MFGVFFSYNLASPEQTKALLEFGKKLDKAHKSGKNIEFLDTVKEIADYQIEPQNANIWGQIISTCCEGRNGALHQELKKLAENQNQQKPNKKDEI